MGSSSDGANTRTIGRAKLLAGVSGVALALAAWLPLPASAADYPVGSEADLRNAITAANADPDSSATITLTGSFAVSNTALPTTPKPITINTQGFTLSGTAGSSIRFPVASAMTLSISGTLVGGTEGTGFLATGPTAPGSASVVNNGSITGGAGNGGTVGGIGVALSNVVILTNNGTITGGTGTATSTSLLNPAAGVSILSGGSLVNNGTIQGGSSLGGVTGMGVFVSGNSATVTNAGTIRGGSDLTGARAGNAAIVARISSQTIVNSGLIEGGNGAAAIITAAPSLGITLVNSGTIRAGVGQADAIRATSSNSTLILELQAGSVIEGNVLAHATRINDVLRLGGTATGTFDVSAIGAAAQYRNFDRFEKTGTSTWILTGTGTDTTPWQILAGTLQLGNGGTSGSLAGDVVNDSTLAFNRSDTLTYGGVISGTGAVNQAGTGTTILTGVNTYAGGTTVSSGRLQIGDGGTTGSIPGEVVNNAILAFNRSDVVTFAGVISGSGAVEQNGTGTTILTGANTYRGGTVLNAGTLAVAADVNLGDAGGGLTFNGGTLQNTAALTMARNATLNAGGGTLQTDADLTMSGVIGGAGGLTKTGSGVLVLTANNTYAGTTTITAGTLQLGNGGTSGAIAGDVANNATLAVNRSDTLVLAGAISGTGTVQQNGTGTTVLTAANTYSGGTTINAGTLQLGNGGVTGSVAGAIANSGTLAFNRTDVATFDNVISGRGGVRQIGSGTTVLTGTSAYTGATSVESGRLAVNGSIAGSIVSVTGGTLAGTGTVGGIVASSSGTVAPGNSIGTLNVTGNVSFAPGSTYEVEIEPAGTSDLLRATGTATLTGGTVSVVKAGGSYAIGSRYTIVTADAGVTGAFDGFTQNLPFINLALTYDPNNVYLDVTRNAVAFCDVAASRNQCAAGRGAESLGAGNTLYDAIASLPDTAAARQAFNVLSGEVHASAKSALIEDSHYLRDAVTNRTHQAGTAGGAAPQFAALAQMADQAQRPQDGTALTAWTQAFGAWARTSGDGNAARLDRTTGGFFIGADTQIDGTWTIGLATGYSRTTLDVDGRSSHASIDSYHLALYGGAQFGPLGLRLGAAHTWHSIDSSRSITFPGFADRAKADYDARTTQLFGDVGYTLAVGNAAIEPFGSLAWVHLDTDRFGEDGGTAALRARSGSDSNLFTTLGVRAAAQVWNDETKTLTVRGKLGWRHAFGDVTPATRLAFASGTSFGVDGVPIGRDAAIVEAGFDLKIGKSLTIGAVYAGVLSGDAQDHSIKGNLAYRF